MHSYILYVYKPGVDGALPFNEVRHTSIRPSLSNIDELSGFFELSGFISKR